MLLSLPALLGYISAETHCQGRSVGRCVEGNYHHPAGCCSVCLFCCFSISDCKERTLVAGLYTHLVRGTKTEREKRRGVISQGSLLVFERSTKNLQLCGNSTIMVKCERNQTRV